MEKIEFSSPVKSFFDLALASFLVPLLLLSAGAGVRAHLEKESLGVEGCANFACRPIARAAKNIKKRNETPAKKRPEIGAETERRKDSETHGKKLNN